MRPHPLQFPPGTNRALGKTRAMPGGSADLRDRAYPAVCSDQSALERRVGGPLHRIRDQAG